MSFLDNGKCLNSKREKDREIGEKEFTFENTFHMKEQEERILQLYTKGSRDMKSNYGKSRTIKPRCQIFRALAFLGADVSH